MVNNLHSLLNRAWYIDQQYAEAQLPMLFNILNGNTQIDPQPESEFVTFLSIDAAASSSNSGRNGQVAVISIKSPIYKYNQYCGPAGTKSMMREMEFIKNDGDVVGVVLDIDSGGGQVSGTPEFYDYIKNYSKPVVAYTDGLMCSAAYYIGSASNYIIANQRADAIGSIGAYSQFLDLKGYYEKQGATLHTIYASKSSEKNKAYNEALEGNYETYIKEELDPIVNDFIEDMKSARSAIDNQVFKGATYNASKSLELNLIDEIGTIQTAIDKVYYLSKTNNQNPNNMSKERTNLQNVLALDGPLATTEDNGSYLNEEQLDAVETAFVNHATALQTAEDAVQAANDAQIQAEDDLRGANQRVTDLETTINALAVKAGVETGETIADTLTAIENRVDELGKQPGDTHTVVKKTNEQPGEHEYIDFDSPIYQN